eukprot:s5354_g1.t2
MIAPLWPCGQYHVFSQRPALRGGEVPRTAEDSGRVRVQPSEDENALELIDVLAAPVLLLPRQPRSILILGLGGGTVARALRALCPEASIVGVEMDDEVLDAARRHFGLDDLGV